MWMVITGGLKEGHNELSEATLGSHEVRLAGIPGTWETPRLLRQTGVPEITHSCGNSCGNHFCMAVEEPNLFITSDRVHNTHLPLFVAECSYLVGYEKPFQPIRRP